jgi:hypothetical protein
LETAKFWAILPKTRFMSGYSNIIGDLKVKATSLLAMTAALCLLSGASAAFADPFKKHDAPDIVKYEPYNDQDKYDLDNVAGTQINDNTITQAGVIDKHFAATSAVEVIGANRVGNVVNVGDAVQNSANTGNISVNAGVGDISHIGHGDSTSTSAVGAASSVSVSISSISTSSGHTGR